MTHTCIAADAVPGIAQDNRSKPQKTKDPMNAEIVATCEKCGTRYVYVNPNWTTCTSNKCNPPGKLIFTEMAIDTAERKD